MHYYEPSQGHGLKYNPFNAIIAPRPIGWISSRDAKGQLNLAPYSFFNAFNYDPPILGFASISWKDSVRNASETGEFVWNLATKELAEQMNRTSLPVPDDVDEFQLAGLTAAPSKHVDVPRVLESRAVRDRIGDTRSTGVRTFPLEIDVTIFSLLRHTRLAYRAARPSHSPSWCRRRKTGPTKHDVSARDGPHPVH